MMAQIRIASITSAPTSAAMSAIDRIRSIFLAVATASALAAALPVSAAVREGGQPNIALVCTSLPSVDHRSSISRG